jgi:hypothetical protein
MLQIIDKITTTRENKLTVLILAPKSNKLLYSAVLGNDSKTQA